MDPNSSRQTEALTTLRTLLRSYPMSSRMGCVAVGLEARNSRRFLSRSDCRLGSIKSSWMCLRNRSGAPRRADGVIFPDLHSITKAKESMKVMTSVS